MRRAFVIFYFTAVSCSIVMRMLYVDIDMSHISIEMLCGRYDILSAGSKYELSGADDLGRLDE